MKIKRGLELFTKYGTCSKKERGDKAMVVVVVCV